MSAQDFYNYKKTMMTMLEKIESERKKYWEENRGEANQQNFSEKDFEFEEEKREPETADSARNKIGGGSYEFLSNYNERKERNQNT